MKKVLLFVGLLLSFSGSAIATENVLQTIEIEPVKDTYNIVLVSDKAVDVKKTVKDANKITLNLKDIRASKTLNTIYNNVSNVDTVMVEPQGNGINIFFQAENASASTVTFDTPNIPIAPIQQQEQKQKIKLNNPIESYAPIYQEENVKTSNLFDRLKKSNAIEGLKDSLDEENTNDLANKFFSFGLIGLLAFAVIKLFKRKEPEMRIGLSQSNDREMDFARSNQNVGINFYNQEKPFTTVNYGLNAYQKENRNPYETAPVHNTRLRNYVTPSINNVSGLQTMSQPIQPQATTAVKTQVQKHTTPVNTAPVNQSNPNIDNLKFLESMTAIYEKSGRHDLARGLKASLSKNAIK